jgi:hypothetical protein
MSPQCRFILLVEYTDDDELISAIGTIEKELPQYDYASRPLPSANPGVKGGFKFLSFKELKSVSSFPKFALKVFKVQTKIPSVRAIPAYVSLTNVVSASPHTTQGAIFGEKELYYKLQLVYSGKTLASHAMTDELFRERRAVLYLNDVWQLVRGANQ